MEDCCQSEAGTVRRTHHRSRPAAVRVFSVIGRAAARAVGHDGWISRRTARAGTVEETTNGTREEELGSLQRGAWHFSDGGRRRSPPHGLRARLDGRSRSPMPDAYACLPRPRPVGVNPRQTRVRNMAYRVAVVGATGAVGREMLKTLVEGNFPISEVAALASGRSTGSEISYGEKRVLKVQNLDTFDFKGWDIGLFSPGAAVSAVHAPRAAAAGCIVIDNTSQFRMDADV